MEFYETPTDFTPYELAEWVEASLLLAGVASVSAAEIEARFPQNQRPDAAEIEELLGEIRRRASEHPTLYPFRASEDEVTTDVDVDATIYRFLLTLSIERAPYRQEQRFNEVSPSLELVTREALLGMLDNRGQARRFGWPNGDGRPEYLGDAVEWLAGEMGLGVGVVQDGGIDVAAWRPFADGGPSFPVFLVQVTTQVTYERKSADVEPDQWVAWIRFGRPPQVGLSVPFAIPPDAKVRLSKLKYSTGLLLDRLRLCELLVERDLTQFDEYVLMSDWTAAEIELIRAAREDPDPRRRPKLAKARRARRPRVV